MPAAAPDLYRASHLARIDQLRRDAAIGERVMREDLERLAGEFTAILREIFARHTPPLVDGLLARPLYAEANPVMAAEVLFVWGNYGDAFDQIRGEACAEIADLEARAVRAEASLTGLVPPSLRLVGAPPS